MRAAISLLLAAMSATGDEAGDRARKLLDEAAELAGSASLEVNVLALQRLGEAYRDFDRGKSVEWLRQAFAATAALPERGRAGAQTRVVKAMSQVDIDAAAALLRAMAEPGDESDGDESAADRVVQLLTKLDGALNDPLCAIGIYMSSP